MRIYWTFFVALSLSALPCQLHAQMDDDDVDNLIVKGLSAQTVRLTWNASSPVPCANAVTYSVFRDTKEDFTPSNENLIASKLSTTHYVAREPKAGENYGYHVRAVRTASRCPADSRSSSEASQKTSDRMQALEAKVEALENKIALYKYLIDEKQPKTSVIQLDPSSRSFQRLDSDSSSFLVSVTDANPYLNGYRLKLDIGNPSSATYPNVSVTIKWTRTYDFDKYTEASYRT
jgi:hypothetical protein